LLPVVTGSPTSLKIERITKRPDFLRANAGKKVVTSVAIIRAITSPEMKSNSCRVGFTVSSACGNAVIRNRIKRRLRAAVATLWPTKAAQGFDYVIIGRAGSEKAVYEHMIKELGTALEKLHA
jgi:ribonuclease P protein component